MRDHNAYGWRILAATGLAALLVTPAMAGDYVEPSFAIASTPAKEDQPAVAFAGGNRFLVTCTVWGTYPSGAPRGSIYGALLDPVSGQISTIPIELSPIYDSSCQAPAVAFDPVNSRYLVVFEDHRPEFTDTDMSAKLLDADGNELAQTVLAFSFGDDITPDVAYIGNDTFLVVWCEVTDRMNPVDGIIRANTVTFDGADLVTGPVDQLVNESAAFDYLGAARPKVAASATGKCLVVWQWPVDVSNPDPATWPHDIQGRVLAVDATPLGQVCNIAAGTDNETAACVAYSASDDKFLTAWQDLRPAGHNDILAAFAGIDASDQVAVGPVMNIAVTGRNDTQPDACWNSAQHEFQIAWQAQATAGNHDIYASRVEVDGTVRREFAVSRRSTMQRRPAVARGLDRTLVVWEDEAVGVTASNVFGACVADTAPPPHVLAVSPALATVVSKSAPLQTLEISFDQDVVIGPGDVTVVGTRSGARNDFALSYDPSTFVATLAWTTALANDTYVVTVADTVKNEDNLKLDGEVSIYSPLLPSGDGAAGGDFVGLIYRLVGDANRDRTVNVFDLQVMAQSWNKLSGQPGYDARADFNADGKVNVFDLQVMAANWTQSIPKGP